MGFRPEQLAELLGIPFSDEQLACICAPLEPAVIVAGAGTGKTTVMAARVVWLVATGQVRSDQVLGLTFTNKATGELFERVMSALVKAGLVDDNGQPLTGEPTVSTYDAFASRLTSTYGLQVGLDTDLQMMADATRFRLAQEVLENYPGELKALSENSTSSVIQYIVSLAAELSSQLISVDDLRRGVDRLDAIFSEPRQTVEIKKIRSGLRKRRELADLIEGYQALKEKYRLIEFGDQMAAAARLVNELPAVGAQLRAQFKVVLLDEYQDTSGAQASLLRTLFSGDDAEHGRGHPVTAVGDPFQAIYAWRGAQPGNILDFSRIFVQVDGSPSRCYSLRTNRRSKPVILAAANAVTGDLRQDVRLQVPGTSEEDQLLRAPLSASGGQVELVGFNSVSEEVKWVAREIVFVKQLNPELPWSQIAILLRNRSLMGALYQELSSLGVPAELVGMSGLLAVPQVAAIVDTLKVLADVTDNESVVKLLAGPRWRLGVQDLGALGAELSRRLYQLRVDAEAAGAGDVGQASPCMLDVLQDADQLALTQTATERVGQFVTEIKYLLAHASEPVVDLVNRIITAQQLLIELAADANPASAEVALQIEQFCREVANYPVLGTEDSLIGLVSWLSASAEYDRGLSQAVPSVSDSVKILTMHAAKGLEWEVVFLPDQREGAFPETRLRDNWLTNCKVLPIPLREDRDWFPVLPSPHEKMWKMSYDRAQKENLRAADDRLAYVAVTRAKSQLYMSYSYWLPERKTCYGPNCYTQKLAELVEQGVAGFGHRPVEPSEETPYTDGSGVEVTWPVPLEQAVIERCANSQADVAAWQKRFAGLSEDEAMRLLKQPLGETAPRDGAQVGVGRVSGVDSRPMGVLDLLSVEDAAQIEHWRLLAAELLAERKSRKPNLDDVPLPKNMSVSAVMMASSDLDAYRLAQLRPMPKPSNQNATLGSRFHEWVAARFGQSHEMDLLDLLDESEPDSTSLDQALDVMKAAFEKGSFAQRVPVLVEQDFALPIAQMLIRGRIDAIFASENSDFDYQVIDWKTSNKRQDPLQLQLYRLAVAQAKDVPVERVCAAFYHVLSGQLEYVELLSASEIESKIAALVDRG